MPVAIVLVSAEIGQVEDVLQRLLDVEEVTEAYSVAGPYSVVAKVETDSCDKLVRVIPKKIHTIPGISKTTTLIAFGLAKQYRKDACEQASQRAKAGKYDERYRLGRSGKQLK